MISARIHAPLVVRLGIARRRSTFRRGKRLARDANRQLPNQQWVVGFELACWPNAVALHLGQRVAEILPRRVGELLQLGHYLGMLARDVGVFAWIVVEVKQFEADLAL